MSRSSRTWSSNAWRTAASRLKRGGSAFRRPAGRAAITPEPNLPRRVAPTHPSAYARLPAQGARDVLLVSTMNVKTEDENEIHKVVCIPFDCCATDGDASGHSASQNL